MTKGAHTYETRELDVAASVEVVTARLSKYLEGAGYRATGSSEFQRGNAWGTSVAFSPRKWHSVVGIQITPSARGSHVIASFDIDTTGQTVTAREALFWKNELAGFEAAAGGQTALAAEVQARKASVENKRSVLVLVALFGLAAVLVGATFFLPKPAHRYSLPLLALFLLLAVWLWSKFQGRLDKKALVEEGKLPPPPVDPS